MGKIGYFLVMNPSSRSGKAKNTCERILSEFRNRELKFDYRMTKGPDEATTYSREAIKNGWDVIVAVGGDGTICEVISGFFKDSKQINNAKLGVLHIGTSPDFNRCHHIPVKLDKAIEVLLNNKTKLIDVGKITYMKSKIEKAISYFGSNVNIGMGPLIANRANSRHRKYLGDFLGTFCASLGSLVNFKGLYLKVKIDGTKTNFNCLLNLTVGKDPYLASGMRVFNEIASDDGRFYILSIEKRNLPSILLNIHKLYMGNFLEYKGANINYGKDVEIDCDLSCIPVEFDGDARGYLPAKVEVINRVLEVIVE